MCSCLGVLILWHFFPGNWFFFFLVILRELCKSLFLTCCSLGLKINLQTSCLDAFFTRLLYCYLAETVYFVVWVTWKEKCLLNCKLVVMPFKKVRRRKFTDKEISYFSEPFPNMIQKQYVLILKANTNPKTAKKHSA